MRTCNVDLLAILDVVNAAEDFGYGDQVLMRALWEWSGGVSDTEIMSYVDWLTEDAKYGEADREEAIRRLREWRARHMS